MNVDSSILQSLLLSTDLDSVSAATPSNGAVSSEFADNLLEKIQQIKGLNGQASLGAKSINQLPDQMKELHELAALMREQGNHSDFSALFGKQLPTVNKLEKSIDLDKTLDALASVIKTLEDVKSVELNLDSKIQKLIDKVETLQQTLPEQPELDDHLSAIVDELKAVKQSVELNPDNNLGNITALIDNPKDALSKDLVNIMDSHLSDNSNNESIDVESHDQAILSNTALPTAQESIDDAIVQTIPLEKTELVARLEKLVEQIDVLPVLTMDLAVDIRSQLEQLSSDIHVVSDMVSEQALALAERVERDNVVQSPDSDQEVVSQEEALIEQQIAAISASLLNPAEKQAVELKSTAPVLPEIKPEIKKEELVLRQMVEEKSLGLVIKKEAETGLSQEPQIQKSTPLNLETPIKNHPQSEILEIKTPETKNTDTKSVDQMGERVFPKFTTDIAMLNRAMTTENKADVEPMTKHFAHPEWNKELSERVIWMHKQEIPSAELRLNPRHLGPVTIKVDVTQDQATVAFTAQHAAVKDAIESAIPKLREMFGSQQLNLVDVNVSQDNSDQKQPRGFDHMGGDQGRGQQQAHEMPENEGIEHAADIVEEIEAGRAIASNGILSLFA